MKLNFARFKFFEWLEKMENEILKLIEEILPNIFRNPNFCPELSA
jgi:hypothetical protein